MAKLTDIKNKINQLDGGSFQNLCDIYLSYKDYGTEYSLGMKTGSDKTAKGNPDTYFLTSDNKFVFAMYSTQQNDFVKKALEDLKKCFNESKTGISPDDIKEIIYCHTYGRLSAGDTKKLTDFCIHKNSSLTLIGIDQLSNDIYKNYSNIAKDFLGIELSTEQISTVKYFIQKHDSNPISAPLKTEFLFRDNEIKSAKESLANHSVLILTGPAGVGKTRLALNICEEYGKKENINVLCIHNNGLSIYDDLISSIEPDKDYIVLVDDANELSQLNLILDLLNGKYINRHISKLILTVRNYAQNKVINDVSKSCTPAFLNIKNFKEEEINKLVQASFGINNPLYLEQINRISNGNARLAMLAGKIAKEKNNFEAILDVTHLYECYYKPQIDKLITSDAILATAGLIAFFQVLQLDNLKNMQPIFELAKLTTDEFLKNIQKLHEYELVDLYSNKASRISDQSFGNFLVKYSFIDKKIIPMSELIIKAFAINKIKTIEACNMLSSIFQDNAVVDYLNLSISKVWDTLEAEAADKNNAAGFFSFIKAFYRIRLTDTLIILKNKIDNETSNIIPVEEYINNKQNSAPTKPNDIINILCGFKYSNQLTEAVELLLQYYEKKPELYDQIYDAFANQLWIDQYSKQSNFKSQRIVVDTICKFLEAHPHNNLVYLFIKLAKHFLQINFTSVTEKSYNTLSLCYIQITNCNGVCSYRKRILNQLYSLYTANNHNRKIELLLNSYLQEINNAYEKLLKSDLPYIQKFLPLFSEDNLLHCLIVEKISRISLKTEYEYKKFLQSEKYKVLNTFVYRKDKSYKSIMKLQCRNIVKASLYSRADYKFLFEVYKEYKLISHGHCGNGFYVIFKSILSSPERYLEIIDEYLKADTPCDLSPDIIMEDCYTVFSPQVIKSLLDKNDFTNKHEWIWQFFVKMPETYISDKWAQELFEFLKNIPQNLTLSKLLPIDKIQKYKSVDRNFILKASRLILETYRNKLFIANLFFSNLFNPLYIQPSQVLSLYEKDIFLLTKVYMTCSNYSVSEIDEEGTFLSYLIRYDENILYQYLDCILENIKQNKYIVNSNYMEKLQFVWNNTNSLKYADQISDYLFEKTEIKYTYNELMSQLLSSHDQKKVIEENQDLWIINTIKMHYLDEERMVMLFYAISGYHSERKIKAVKMFLNLNNNYSTFEKLQLEPNMFQWSRSQIPLLQNRIDYLESLLPLLSGIKYIKHKQKIEKHIGLLQDCIREEEIKDMFEVME